MRSYSRRTHSFDNFNKRMVYDDMSDDPDMKQYDNKKNNKHRSGGDDFAKVQSHSLDQPNSPTENEERSAYRQINRNTNTKSKYLKFRVKVKSQNIYIFLFLIIEII